MNDGDVKFSIAVLEERLADRIKILTEEELSDGQIKGGIQDIILIRSAIRKIKKEFHLD